MQEEQAQWEMTGTGGSASGETGGRRHSRSLDFSPFSAKGECVFAGGVGEWKGGEQLQEFLSVCMCAQGCLVSKRRGNVVRKGNFVGDLRTVAIQSGNSSMWSREYTKYTFERE